MKKVEKPSARNITDIIKGNENGRDVKRGTEGKGEREWCGEK